MLFFSWSWLRNCKSSLERRLALRQILGGKRQRSNTPSRRGMRKFTLLNLEPLESRLAPAVLTVNTTADVVNPSDGTLSLRDAISAINAGNANGLTAGEQNQVAGTFGSNDTIQFDNSRLSGKTITLNGNALPTITQNVTIDGLGAGNLAISGNNLSGIFQIDAGATVGISGLTIEDSIGTDNGGVIQNFGTLTLNGVQSDAAVVLANNSLTTVSASSIQNDLTIAGGTLQIADNLTVTGQFNSSGGTVSGLGSGKLTTQGSANLSGTLDLVDGTELENDGTFDVSGTVTDDGSAILNNYGTLDAASTNTALVAVDLNNYGTIDVQSGELNLGNNTSYAGSTVTAAAGTLLGLGGPTTFQSGSTLQVDQLRIADSATFSGYYKADDTQVNSGFSTVSASAIFTGEVHQLGTLEVYDGSADFSAATLDAGAGDLAGLTLYGATVTIPGNLSVAGALSIGYSTLTSVGGAATLTAQGGGSIGDVNLEGFTLKVPVNTTVNVTNTLSLLDGALLENYGILNLNGVLNLSSTVNGDATAVLNNYGTLEATSPNSASVAVTLNNYGTIDVQSGALDTGVTTGYAGSTVTAAPGTLLWLGGRRRSSPARRCKPIS